MRTRTKLVRHFQKVQVVWRHRHLHSALALHLSAHPSTRPCGLCLDILLAPQDSPAFGSLCLLLLMHVMMGECSEGRQGGSVSGLVSLLHPYHIILYQRRKH